MSRRYDNSWSKWPLRSVVSVRESGHWRYETLVCGHISVNYVGPWGRSFRQRRCLDCGQEKKQENIWDKPTIKLSDLPDYAGLVVRFWAKVDKSGECWVWTGRRQICKGKKRYGRFWVGGRERYAHRIAFLLSRGELSRDKDICHTCDNEVCCRPDHLYAGTAATNWADMHARGRWKRVYVGRRGEQSNLAKLTDTKVKDILRRLSIGEARSSIARDLGVSQPSISRIARGKTWSHVRLEDNDYETGL